MEELELRQYLTLLRKWLWLIVLGTLLAGGTAYLVSINMPPIYETTATLLVTHGEDPTLSGASTNPYILSRLASNYADLLDQPVILEATAERLGLDRINPEDVTVDWAESKTVIKLIVKYSDANLAAQIANTIPAVFIERNASLQSARFAESKDSLSQELARLQSDVETTQTLIDAIGTPTAPADEAELSRLETVLARYRYNYGQLLASYESIRLTESSAVENIVVFQEAMPPLRPISPKVPQNTLLAAVVGAMLAVGVAFLVEYLDDTLKTPEDVTLVMGLNTLGSIARLRSGRRGEEMDGLVTAVQPKSPVSEAFRVLRTNIQFSGVDKPIRRLLVTSASPSEGKSLTTANLAIVFAQAGQSVVLVDTDLRRPAQHKFFDLPNKGGVTNSLLGDANPGADEWLLPTDMENLHLLTSGPLPPNPAELVGSQRMGQYIEHLEQRFDIVIFDTPPVLAVTDAAVLSRQVDGVLVVVEAGGTRQKEARRIMEELSRVEAPILGVVINKVPIGRRGDYYYRDYYAAADEEGIEEE